MSALRLLRAPRTSDNLTASGDSAMTAETLPRDSSRPTDEDCWQAVLRRDAAWDANGGTGRPAADVFRDAMARLS